VLEPTQAVVALVVEFHAMLVDFKSFSYWGVLPPLLLWMMTMQGRSHEHAVAQIFYEEFLVMHAHYRSCIVITPNNSYPAWLNSSNDCYCLFFPGPLVYNLPLVGRDYRYAFDSSFHFSGMEASGSTITQVTALDFWAPDIWTLKVMSEDKTQWTGYLAQAHIKFWKAFQGTWKRDMLHAVQGWKLRLL
jgi:hypothetical protein